MKELKINQRVSCYGTTPEYGGLNGWKGTVVGLESDDGSWGIISLDGLPLQVKLHRRQCVPLRKKKKRREWWINEYSNGEAYLYTDPERAKYYDAGAKTFHVREVREGR